VLGPEQGFRIRQHKSEHDKQHANTGDADGKRKLEHGIAQNKRRQHDEQRTFAVPLPVE
jgi:hypothetical protein